MTDQEGLLTAIRDQPEEDAPRLIYADWLDEHGTTDQDAARAEFIRLSCGVGYGGDQMRSKMRLGVKEGKWLDANWKRLVPNLVACATPRKEIDQLATRPPRPAVWVGGIEQKRAGRELRLRIFYAWDSEFPDRARAYCSFTFSLCFWRGFLETFWVYNLRAFYLIGGVIAADDPLAQPRIANYGAAVGRTNEDADARHLTTISDGNIGPMFSHLEGWDFYRKLHPTTQTEAKLFEQKQREGEAFFERLDSAVRNTATRWMRENAGKSLHSHRGNNQSPQYQEVKLPLDTRFVWRTA